MTQRILQEERKLWKKGYKKVACLDESGRGPLAGPVIAAAVSLIPNSNWGPSGAWEGGGSGRESFPRSGSSRPWVGVQFPKIRDSKKLSAKKREEFYKILTKNLNIAWGIGRVSEKVIDKINILEATKLAMKKALLNLEKRLKIAKRQKINDRRKFAKSLTDFLIIDGNFKIDMPIPQKSIIKADQIVFSCMAASIIAKVTRDRMMKKFHKKYPRYGFNQHKGYPTKLHFKMLRKYGPCEIYRKSFKPVKKLLIANC